MARLDQTRRLLLRRLRDLGGRLDGIERELLAHSDPDWEDQAQKREGDDVLHALDSAAQREIGQIRAALSRIADGSYGQCTACGEKIDADRLAALPETPLCRTCANVATR